MKKILPLLVVVVIGVALWFAVSSREERAGSDQGQSVASIAAAPAGGALQNDNNSLSGSKLLGGNSDEDEDDDGEGLEDYDDRPATEIYSNVGDALQAVKNAAKEYDDLVLDQFTDLDENCTWCDSFYTSVKEMMFSPNTGADEKSYYAELLAVSGRLDNIKTLVDSIKNAKNPDDADLYAEALELSAGKNDVVKFLGEQLNQDNDVLQEASVAAITNQGSRLAAETLYKHTLERGDPDGYYSMGIGIGELVPEEEALPYLQELVMKRDQYSHLAVKSLLNGGLDGLKIVVDVLSSSNRADFDKQMLNGAIDHVSYDDDVIDYLKQLSTTSKNAVVQQFAKDVLDDVAETEDDSDLDEDVPFTPLEQ